jgi:hypothetical protein
LAVFGLDKLIPSFDILLKEGNPHYKYANSFANGISICDVTASEVNVSFLIVKDVTTPGIEPELTIARFRTRSGTNKIEVVQG